MSHALCVMAGFLGAGFTLSSILEMSGEKAFGCFLGAAACLAAAAVLRVAFNQ